MRNINKVIIHCSDSDNPHHDNVKTIRQWHLDRGWQDIGYHFVITKNGRIKWGRSLEMIGAHCKGHNIDSIGICLTGRNNFSQEQFYFLEVLLKKIMREFKIPKENIFGHNHFNKHKTCPNFDLSKIIEQL